MCVGDSTGADERGYEEFDLRPPAGQDRDEPRPSGRPMTSSSTRTSATRTLRLAFAAALLSGAAACGGAQSVAVDPIAFEQMRTRVAELERTNGYQRVQIEEMEERIFLLQDRVEANRLAQMRRDSQTGFGRQPVHIGANGQSSPWPASVTVPTASAPPPRPDIDPLALPQDLPVQRLGPGGAVVAPAPIQVAAAEPEGEEVVIDMAAYNERFGGESGGSTSPSRSTGSSSAATPTRRAQPRVDTGGHRLPIATPDPAPAATPEPSAPAPSASATSDNPMTLYRQGRDEFEAGEYSEAVTTFNRFIESGPTEDYMDNALFWMGEAYYGMGRYNDALGFFQRVVSEYPDGNKVPDSLLKIALSNERLTNVDAAVEVLNVLVDTYPSTDAARRATERLRALQP